jgi:tetratricopeptide (TPR) repeat protein
VLLLASIMPGRTFAAETTEASCPSMIGRIVSVQGTVEVRRAGQSNWIPVTRLDLPLCQGDWLRTAPRSRAALVILPEKFVRIDQNSTLSVSIAGDETVVEFLQSGDQSAQVDGASCGAGYFITRFPRKFKVRTKYLNASVEGTEFLVGVACAATQIAVFEGKVSAQPPQASTASFMLTPGQTVSNGPNETPAVKVLVKPTDAVQWALFYPPLTEPDPQAVDRACPDPANADKARCLVQRAEQRLRVGRVDDASADIAEARTLLPNDADAAALLAIIGVVKNEKAGALAMADRAIGYDARSTRAWIARSYAQQANFQLDSALSSARQAVTLDPRSSVAQARVAELLMSLGRIREAEAAARAAVAANANDSRAHTVLGFVHLAQIDVKRAREDFLAAIERDSSDPLPRLGLGLALIRTGKLVPGREQIEIAVALDPTNALVRSYVGKAYYEENTGARERLAGTQLEMAKQLDPNDPTPWLYDAIRKQTENRPVEALKDVQKSIELNDERAVYRSRLLLDEDLAARSTSLARIYSDLSFEQLAQVEGWRSLQADPTNFSAHRFLSDSYLTQPRHEIGRLSELLQSQLWQPLNLTPLQPQIGETGLSIPSGVGPPRVSYDEYSNLFVRDGLHLYANGIVGQNETFGDDLVVSGLTDRYSFSLGQYHYQTEGFRPNNDQTRDLYNVFVQAAISPDTSVQAEYRTQKRDAGDLQLRFDPNNFFPIDRINEKIDTARIGLRHDLTPDAQMIVSVLGQQSSQDQVTQRIVPAGPFRSQTDTSSAVRQTATVVEAQLVNRWSGLRLISGASYFNGDNEGSATAASRLLRPAPLPPLIFRPQTQPIDSNTNQSNVYSYGTFAWPSTLAWTLGLSVNNYDSLVAQGTRANPKLGLIFTPTATTTLRAAALRVVRRDLVSNQTIEPTQVAGFNQFFDDSASTQAKMYGLGIDQRLSANWYAGAEATKRELNIPFLAVGPRTSTVLVTDATQWLNRAYLYWTPTQRLGLRAEYQYEDLVRDPRLISNGFDYISLRTQRVPIGLSWFDPSGITLTTTATFTDQSGKFVDTLTSRGSSGQDDFWLVDAQLSYRLPRRYGLVSVGVKNLFDRHFRFHEPDPTNPTVYPERFLYMKLELSF